MHIHRLLKPSVSHHNDHTTLPDDRHGCRAGVLDDFPTSCSEDETMLARDTTDGALNEREVLAIRWRCLYKRSLLNCIALAQAVMRNCQLEAQQGLS